MILTARLLNNLITPAYLILRSVAVFSPFLFKEQYSAPSVILLYMARHYTSVVLLDPLIFLRESEIDCNNFSVGSRAWARQQLAKGQKSSWGITYNYGNVGLYLQYRKAGAGIISNFLIHSGDANFRIKNKEAELLNTIHFAYNQLGCEALSTVLY